MSLIPGQLARISIGSNALTLTDIFVSLTSLLFLIYSLILKRPLKLPPGSFFVCLFIILATSSNVLALNNFSTSEVIIATFFLVRFIMFYLFAITAYNIVQKNRITNWLNILLIIGLVFSILGFLQILLFPDLTHLSAYGWDPHQRRIVSSLLDPNFTGGLILFLFCISTSLFIFQNKRIYAFLSAIFFIAIILTFSRSTYAAFFTAIITIGVLKSPRILLYGLFCFLAAYILIAQVRTRTLGAFTIDETASARITSWQKAVEIFVKNPIFGSGFNTYRFAQIKYGNFTFNDPQGGHSGAGSDSSILTIAATTGIIGLIAYSLMTLSFMRTFIKKAKTQAINLALTSSFAGLLVHSQFVNSLFFPQIVLIFWFLLGVSARSNENKAIF